MMLSKKLIFVQKHLVSPWETSTLGANFPGEIAVFHMHTHQKKNLPQTAAVKSGAIRGQRVSVYIKSAQNLIGCSCFEW